MPATSLHDPPSIVSPGVGIFWGLPGPAGGVTLVADRTPLGNAEAYDMFLTHPSGHYEVWEAWRRHGAAALARRGLPAAIAWHEYEEFPRGRVVYDTSTARFMIYADRRLQGPRTAGRIVRLFGLAGEHYEILSDPHYRTGTHVGVPPRR